MKICTVLEQRREALRAEYPFWTKKTLYDHPYLAEAVLSSGKADQVVISAGIRADGALLKELETLGVKAISAGDASRGKNGLANIYEGFLAGVRV